ncbi:hypothetical protein [Paenibacillus sp. SYP-B3998]|uniref:hypothetical protein n=1 Tax=Paenibacillus sp. SYP-B3998 TaxID=2678564 RepID=UPI001F0873BC|nr:hypothetical protein [Paenibacillus sp. SYP-B3998]
MDNTLHVYVNGAFAKSINLTSRYAWLYGDETAPVTPANNTPQAVQNAIDQVRTDQTDQFVGVYLPA